MSYLWKGIQTGLDGHKVVVIDGMIIILLGMMSVMDIRKRRIPIWSLVVFGLLSVVGTALLPLNLWTRITGISIGLCMVGMAYVTRGAVGYADGILLLAIGNLFGGEATLQILFYALLPAMGVGMLLMVLHKADRKTTLPFIPFLLFGEVLQVIWGG